MMILIDSLISLNMLILLLPWLSCSLWHACSYCYISCLTIDSLAWILSWLFSSMLCLLFILFSYARLDCVWTWMIYLHPTWLFVAWLLFSCVFACCLFVRAAHLSPYLQPSSFDHFLHFDFIFANMRPCVCLFL